MATTIKNREDWLNEAVKELRPLFKKQNASLPAGKAGKGGILVGCGWPKGGKNEVIGQCFSKAWTQDGTTHIFISPTQASEIEVLAVLAHELVHAAVGVEEGHRGRFATVARAIGLEGKLTHTVVTEASPLYVVLARIAKKLGAYPHSRMIAAAGKSKKKEGGSSWIRLRSKKIATYTLVISRKSLDNYGYPVDPEGMKMVEK